MLLQHMVLSHHGKEEWGSPKRPMLKEAEILHYIDNIDAKMNMLDRAMSKTANGEFSERIFPLDNRSFYKPNLNNKVKFHSEGIKSFLRVSEQWISSHLTYGKRL